MPFGSAASEKAIATTAQLAERAEYHAAAGFGVRAARDLHHHDSAIVERPGDEPSFAKKGETAIAAAENQPFKRGRHRANHPKRSSLRVARSEADIGRDESR